MDVLDAAPGKDWSCVTLSLSMISPLSLIVCCGTIPCGATSAAGNSLAKGGGRGSA